MTTDLRMMYHLGIIELAIFCSEAHDQIMCRVLHFSRNSGDGIDSLAYRLIKDSELSSVRPLDFPLAKTLSKHV